jgi:DNA polymerase-1
MFVPKQGHVFIGADYDQLEFRFAAALAGCEFYLDAFREQKDPYNITGEAMFTKKFWEQPGAPDTPKGKGTGAFKKLRNLAKTICLASLYGAGPRMVYEIVSRAEDDDGNMAYAHFNKQQIGQLHRAWKRRAHEFETWWNETAAFRRDNGYVEEIVTKRRRYFIEEDFNAQLNFGAQAGGFAVVSQGMLELVEDHIPFDCHEKSGLVNQLHDAVLFTVKEGEADYLKDVVTHTLTRRVPTLDILFTAEASIGTTWREV